MKKIVRFSLLGLLFIFIYLCFPAPSKVNAGINNVALQPVYVSDLDNVLYPSTSAYNTYDGLQGVGSFTVKQPTIVKAYFNWDNTTNKNITGNAWFSRDPDGIDVIGTYTKLQSVGDSIIVFLDPGTYYVNFLFSVKNSSSTWVKIGVALLAEDVRSNETVYVSSYNKPNVITSGVACRGLLSTSAPLDYYKFEVKHKSRVTVSYNFEQTGDINVTRGICTLYDSLNQKITSKGFSSGGTAANQFSEMLDPGTYYVALSGTTCATNVLVDVVSYNVKTKVSEDSWTGEDVVVSVLYDFDAVEVLYVKDDVTDVNIKNNNIWNTRLKTVFKITGNKFTVDSNGYYTIRIQDKDYNYVLARIKIDNIDKTKPKVKGVANNKTYKSGVTIKFSDTGSGIKKAYLNGKGIKNGTKVTKPGKYTLEVHDKAFNITKIKFTIKK